MDCTESKAPEIEVTPEMIEAGVNAYYENAVGGWENPGDEELQVTLREIFRAMFRRHQV